MKSRIEILQPTVIPAQPGFRNASMFLDEALTDATAADQVEIIYEPIIAWIIRPVLAHQSPDNIEMMEPEVTPVLISGEPRGGDYIVDNSGQWSRIGMFFNSEQDAREDWLAQERKG